MKFLNESVRKITICARPKRRWNKEVEKKNKEPGEGKEKVKKAEEREGDWGSGEEDPKRGEENEGGRESLEEREERRDLEGEVEGRGRGQEEAEKEKVREASRAPRNAIRRNKRKLGKSSYTRRTATMVGR